MNGPTQRALMIYSMTLTLLLASLFVSGLTPSEAPMEELTVQRINIVEPDGTLRMVISNHERLPGIIVRGEERPFERSQAGMIFLNDESSEIGGLIFGGRRDEQGRIIDSGGSLSFDRYEANQVVQLIGVEDHENRFAGVSVTDSPTGSEVYRRAWLGRGADGISTLALMDGKGRRRIVLEVEPDGRASLSFLDENGKIVEEIVPAQPTELRE